MDEMEFSQQFTDFVDGMFFGVLLVLAIVNLIYYFIHHDKSYIIYSVYIFILIYYEASTLKYIDATSFGNFPELNLILENISLHLTLMFYLVFLKSFINIKSRFPKWSKIVNYLVVGLGINIFISSGLIYYFNNYDLAISERSIFFAIALPITCILLIDLYLKGNKIDHIFIVGSSFLLGSGLISILIILFFDYQDPDMIFQIGILIELIIFNIGLGVKSRYHENEKQLVQSKLIEQLEENKMLQLSVTDNLERQVNERTIEIQTQNEELLQQQEELASHRDALEDQNKVIAQSMKELESIKSQLELIVEERTLQLKKANQELVLHNSQLEQYAFITAHNLRGPVARLKGLMYIFENSTGINEQNEDVVKKIMNAAIEMDDVLSDMNYILELKNKDIGQSHEVDIEVIFGKVRKILFDNLRESNAEIKLNLDVQHVYANDPYLESVLYNLVSNAIKYRSESRTLKIGISSYKADSKVILQISDNGLGIDISKAEGKIFGLYQRFHDHIGGKGLGLYLVKTQVEALGGSIEIESEIAKGTTFKIALPE